MRGRVVDEVRDRAGVVGERDQPRRVGVLAAADRRVTRVQRPDRLQVGLDRAVQHQVLGAVLLDGDDLRFPGIRVQHHAVHVGLGVRGQHLDLAAGHVDPDQPGRVRVDGRNAQQRPAVLAERDDVAGGHVVGGDCQQRPPVVQVPLPDQELHVPVGLGRVGRPDDHVLVGQPAREARVLHFQGHLAGQQVEPEDVVQLRVLPVEPDQDLGRELLVRRRSAGPGRR